MSSAWMVWVFPVPAVERMRIHKVQLNRQKSTNSCFVFRQEGRPWSQVMNSSIKGRINPSFSPKQIWILLAKSNHLFIPDSWMLEVGVERPVLGLEKARNRRMGPKTNLSHPSIRWLQIQTCCQKHTIATWWLSQQVSRLVKKTDQSYKYKCACQCLCAYLYVSTLCKLCKLCMFVSMHACIHVYHVCKVYRV